MNPIAKILGIALLAGLTPILSAETLESGTSLTPERFEIYQIKADAEYKNRNYTEAFKLYSGVLAPNGDAYAQYMTGFMLGQGIGTPADAAAGAAWLSLAAEQGNQEIYAYSNTVNAALSPGDERQADRLYRKLKDEYGGCALQGQLIEQLESLLSPKRKAKGSTGTNRITLTYGADALGAGEETQRERLKQQRKSHKSGCNR